MVWDIINSRCLVIFLHNTEPSIAHNPHIYLLSSFCTFVLFPSLVINGLSYSFIFIRFFLMSEILYWSQIIFSKSFFNLLWSYHLQFFIHGSEENIPPWSCREYIPPASHGHAHRVLAVRAEAGWPVAGGGAGAAAEGQPEQCTVGNIDILNLNSAQWAIKCQFKPEQCTLDNALLSTI